MVEGSDIFVEGSDIVVKLEQPFLDLISQCKNQLIICFFKVRASKSVFGRPPFALKRALGRVGARRRPLLRNLFLIHSYDRGSDKHPHGRSRGFP